METWKVIVGFDRYEVSSYGRVRKRDTGAVLSTSRPDRITGYCKVALMGENGKFVAKTVHRLVAQAFIPNPDGKQQVHHKDRDKTNNNASNLAWVDPKEHRKLDARPLSETAYFKNFYARKKMANNVQ